MGYIGVISHLLTIDPNFLEHPSREPLESNMQKIHPGNLGNRYHKMMVWKMYLQLQVWHRTGDLGETAPFLADI